MDNLQSPAYPQPIIVGPDQTISATTEYFPHYAGFSKLERASLMIAQGLIAAGAFKDDEQYCDLIAKQSVNLAKAIIESANK